ncbi:MAG: hypothetical protein V1874_10600 [Spirochaetota bacterium]
MKERIKPMCKKLNITSLCVIAIIILFSTTGANATIVKTSHSKLLGNLTVVPATAREAYSKCIKEGNGELKVNTAIKKISDQLEAFIKENAVPYSMGPMMKGEAPKNMPSKEQMRKMTQQEKIDFAMKMQSQMNTNTAPKNTVAWAKCIELNNKFAELFSNDPLSTKLMSLEMRFSPEHDKINADTDAAVKTCPVISTGESSAPDEKCVKSKKLAGADKQIALTAKELGELRTILKGHADRIKGLITELDQLMSDVQFGDGVDDEQSKTMLNQVQGLAFQQLMQLQSYAQNAYTKAAKWIAEREKINERQ